MLTKEEFMEGYDKFKNGEGYLNPSKWYAFITSKENVDLYAIVIRHRSVSKESAEELIEAAFNFRNSPLYQELK